MTYISAMEGFFTEEEKRDEDILNHKKELETKIRKKQSVEKIIKFLLANEKLCVKKIFKAQEENDRNTKELYNRALNENIEPLLTYWLSKIDGNSCVQNVAQTPVDVTPTSASMGPMPGEPSQESFHEQIYLIGVDPQKIMDFFMQLTLNNNEINGEPYMIKNDVRDLVENNFVGFNRQYCSKYYDLNLTGRQKGKLRFFINQFCDKFHVATQGTKPKLARFLIKNFELFKDDDIKSLLKNFSKAPIVSSRIRVK